MTNQQPKGQRPVEVLLALADRIEEALGLPIAIDIAAAAELRRLHRSEREGWRYADELEQERKRLHQFEIAFTKYLEKTEWVQETAKYYELGMDRADVLKQRIDRLHKANQMLLEALGLFNITCGHLHHNYEDRHEHDDCPVVRKVYAAIAKAGEA